MLRFKASGIGLLSSSSQILTSSAAANNELVPVPLLLFFVACLQKQRLILHFQWLAQHSFQLFSPGVIPTVSARSVNLSKDMSLGDTAESRDSSLVLGLLGGEGGRGLHCY